jgi:hypothetical protein
MGGSGKPSSSASSTKDLAVVTDIDDDEDDDEDERRGIYITADEVAKIFDKLFLEVQHVFSALMQQIQAMQMQGAAMPEAALKQAVRSELEKAVLNRQQQLLAECDMDYDCLEEATWEFLDREAEYPGVKKAVERFQGIWQNATGDQCAGWRPGRLAVPTEPLSPERTVEVAQKYFEALTDCMRVIVAEYKAEGRDLQDRATAQRLNMEFAAKAQDAGEAALEAEGVSLRQFEASVKHHGNDPTVSRSLAVMQMQQQQAMSQMDAS